MSIIKICGYCDIEFEDTKREKSRRYCTCECYNAARIARSDAKYIGQKFGRLTVLTRVDAKYGPTYLCRCDCGNETRCDASSLVSGETVSCGCHRREVGKRMQVANGLAQKKIILVGTRFERLIVLRESGMIYGSHVAYDCQCDCGEIIRVSGRSLRTGNCKSCGCYHKDVSRKQAKRLFTKHGHSAEKWYLQWMRRRRNEADRKWTTEMEQLLFRLQPVCVVCGSDDRLAVDHVVPLAKDGKLEPGNVVVLCKSHNSAKYDKSLAELDRVMAEKIYQAAQEFLEAWQGEQENA